MNIAMIGNGAYGSALTSVLESNGHDVKPYRRNDSLADLKKLVNFCDVVVMAIPSTAIDEFYLKLKPLLKGKIVINAAKGLSTNGKMLSEVFASEMADDRFVALSGPGFADEIKRRLPTVLTSSHPIARQLLENDFLKVEVAHDVVGVLACGVFKNVFAIGAGMTKGLKLGKGAEAALIHKALNEIRLMVKDCGGKVATVDLACGVGDLVLTCSSEMSRNFSFGLKLAQGKNIENAVAAIGTVEGVGSLKNLPSGDYQLANAIRQIVLFGAPMQILPAAILP
jgi:glycerol-3-phosphate dehydrogenase (NAD(P)+)